MTQIPDGYVFHPDNDRFTFGHPSVDIYLTGKPVERFFDAHKAVFPIAGGNGIMDLVVTHPWLAMTGAGAQRICAGRFHLHKPDGHTHYGFSLGGDLSITAGEELTTCTLTSSAPIFNLQDNPESPGVLLAGEFEGLLARRRAAWGDKDAAFADRMASLEPIDLFAACVKSLEQDLQSLPGSMRSKPRYQKILRALHAAHDAIDASERQSAPDARLEDLL